ncbi:MurR/RpiR family transcriptional regulator [Shouchella clausii]|jgi:RpiR family transcriptional regulator, glv operon transcriptional regulator|uniref:MurR/RpiR family transcriptional regulator n=1 Tax=Shouchella clausii TaxID=79880 RepID=UPI000B969D6D|nr:MurR/RpiR family transcriptional regulator [Shouchella clausii]SPU22409.1 transcriptional regulator [Niallia circulans]AST97684.1 transcriptional regulator [Shouchella clausii]MBU8595025.1 MurR/RpiR family transcriptional regulator [Shouchella clausii]MCM3549395.1 MurR/RpiR family transcriptional regulator [Shouchella clausii]MCR1290199.1 MurR/RpiR family transcriptional regulator [Shouchella clausii]
MFDILKNYEELTVSEKRVLSYIMENQDQIPHIKINDLAEATFVSKTVIINLAQKLDFSGFREMKYYISQKIIEKMSAQETSTVLYRENLKQSIDKTFSLVTEDQLQKTAAKIKAAKNVFIMARGTSKAVGYYFEHLLLTIGIQCIFIKDYNLSEVFTDFVAEDDIVIFISLSGDTKKIIDTAKKIHLKKAEMISITSFNTNELTRYTTNNLFCYTDKTNTSKNDTISRTGFFLTIDLLVDKLANL